MPPFWSSFCCQWTPETSWVLAHNIPRLLLKDKSFSQIPPLMLGKTGLVVSPLISLMEDQVAALNAQEAGPGSVGVVVGVTVMAAVSAVFNVTGLASRHLIGSPPHPRPGPAPPLTLAL